MLSLLSSIVPRYARAVFRMAVGHSDDVDAQDAVEAVVAQCEEALGGVRPKAGLLFSTYDTDPRLASTGIRAAFPDIELVGSTSVGEMSSVLGFRDDSITLALFASDTVDITAGMGGGVSADAAIAASDAVGEAVGKTDKEPRLCITTPCISGDDPSSLLQEIRREIGHAVPVLGGGSGPRTEPGERLKAYQFYNDSVLQDAAPVLLFSGPLRYAFGIDTGWKPVGRKGVVTDAGGGTIVTIDHEPALAFFEHYLGSGAKPTPANPLAVFDSDADADPFYLRVPLSFDAATGAVRVAGGVTPGAHVQLTIAVTDEILEGTRSAVQKAIKAYPDDASSPQGALIFSCAIRKLVLGTRSGTELDIARDELGAGVPICGFYCFGEIAPLEGGSTRFHNETIVAVMMGEAA